MPDTVLTSMQAATGDARGGLLHRVVSPVGLERASESGVGAGGGVGGVLSRIVALSGGKDSTAMALRLAEAEPAEYEFCITPTGRELPVMNEHWAKLECLLGKPLIRVPAPTLVELIVKYKAVPNFRMRFCTRQIKIEPFQAYDASKSPAVCYVGIRADETDGREGSDHSKLEGVTQDFPLARWGWHIGDVRNYLRKRGVDVPERTDCDWCYNPEMDGRICECYDPKSPNDKLTDSRPE